MNFISPEELEQLKKGFDLDLFNEILSRVHNSAVETSMCKIPKVLTRLIATTTATEAMSKAFYETNKDFVDHKDIVEAVVMDIDSKNPAMDYRELLKEAEPIIREKIKNEKLHKGLPCDLPEKVNLNGNGVIL